MTCLLRFPSILCTLLFVSTFYSSAEESPLVKGAGADPVPSAASTQYSVRQTPSGPVLFANDRPLAPTMFFLNIEGDIAHANKRTESLEWAKRSDVEIVSITHGPLWPIVRGGKPEFSETLARVREVIKRSPNAKILLRVHLVIMGPNYMPKWWYEAHPEEILRTQKGPLEIPSIFSEVWRAEAQEYLTQMIEALEAEVGSAMIGYHLCGMETGEWFSVGCWEGQVGGYEPAAKVAFREWLRKKYKTEAAISKAWNSPDVLFDTVEPPLPELISRTSSSVFEVPDAHRQVMDYFEFWNESVADVALLMCRTVKKIAPHRLTALFYGYHYELSGIPLGQKATGHMALRRILQAPEVDILCSPLSYSNRLHGADGVGMFMNSVDSIQLAGKLYVREDDTRTHLSNDTTYGIPSLANARHTAEVLIRNFSHLVTRGAGVWWMDLYGDGSFLGEDVWTPIEKMSDAMRETYGETAPYRPEIAVIFDEASVYAHPAGMKPGSLQSLFREHLHGIGAPVGFYMLDDVLAGRVTWPKLMIFVNAYRLTPDQRAKLRAVTRRGTNVWMYAAGYVEESQISAEGISELTGVHVLRMEDQPISVQMTDGQVFDWGTEPISPGFYIEDKATQTLGVFKADQKVAIAVRESDGTRDIVCYPLIVPANVMAKWAKEAGVHLYAQPGDVIAEGKGFIGLSARSAGMKKLDMPVLCSLQDVVSGEVSPSAKVHQFEMELGEARLWKILQRQPETP